MRRTLAAAVLGVSLWIGALAWSGFLLTRTVLDPGRSENVADALYEDDAVREQLASNIADAIEAALPDGVPVERDLIENAAAEVLSSPVVETLFVDAFVATHKAFLGEGDAPERIDAGAFGSEARRSLVSARPELDGVLPAAPSLVIELPTERIPNLGPLRDVLNSIVPVAAAVAAAGVLLAMVITKNRPAILRRAGIWALGMSAAVLAFAYGIPWLAERFAPDQSEVVAALVGAMASTTRTPAVALAVVGAAAIGTSLVWKIAPAAAGVAGMAGSMFDSPADAAAPETATAASRRTPWTQRRDIPTPRQTPVSAAPPRSAPVPPTADVTRALPREPDGYGTKRPAPPDPHPGYPESRPRPTARPDVPNVADARGGSDAPTRITGQPSGSATPGTSKSAPPPGTNATFVDGVGWVLDTTDAIPDGARWVPGVGYVVDAD